MLYYIFNRRLHTISCHSTGYSYCIKKTTNYNYHYTYFIYNKY